MRWWGRLRKDCRGHMETHRVQTSPSLDPHHEFGTPKGRNSETFALIRDVTTPSPLPLSASSEEHSGAVSAVL